MSEIPIKNVLLCFVSRNKSGDLRESVGIVKDIQFIRTVESAALFYLTIE